MLTFFFYLKTRIHLLDFMGLKCSHIFETILYQNFETVASKTHEKFSGINHTILQ